MKRTLLIAALCITAALAQAAMAADAPPPPPMAPPATGAPVNPQSFPRPCILYAFRFLHPRALDMMVRELNLSDTQKTQVIELIGKLDETSRPLVEAQRKAAEDFAVAMANPSITPQALTAASEKVMKAEQDLMVENIKALYAIKSLLTADQQPQWTRFLEQRTMPYRAPAPGPQGPPPPPGQPPAPRPVADSAK